MPDAVKQQWISPHFSESDYSVGAERRELPSIPVRHKSVYVHVPQTRYQVLTLTVDCAISPDVPFIAINDLYYHVSRDEYILLANYSPPFNVDDVDVLY